MRTLHTLSFFSLFILTMFIPTQLFAEKRFRPFLESTNGDLKQASNAEELTFSYSLNLPKDYALNEEAPSDYQLFVDDGENSVTLRSNKLTALQESIPFTLKEHSGNIDLVFESTVYYCKHTERALCLTKSFRYTQPLWVERDGPTDEIHFSPSEQSFRSEQ
ncbi:MAG: hypothetical protein KDD55_10965 [Bdellovibrionales bacterium]|nr:hypothetical protein [Bdellovibrionales bacterium]